MIDIIQINKASIDSLSLKILFNDCQILDARLTSETCIYYASLEEIDCELHPPKPLMFSENGITVRIGLFEMPIYNNITKEKVLTKFINLTISAKLLKHRYFEGINKKNIYLVFTEFLKMKVFRCSFDTFLDGLASDTDICVNKYIPPTVFLDTISYIAHSMGTKQRFANLINKEDNLGLSINERSKARPSTPFIKYYYKHFELLTKSSEFYDKYLAPTFSLQIENLSRIEVTIKNYAHKQRLANYKIIPQFKTLRELLEISSDDLLKVVRFSCSGYIETQIRLSSPELTPNDFLIFELVQNCILKGYDLKTLLLIADRFKGHNEASQTVAQSRLRTKIKEMYNLNKNKDLMIAQKCKANEIMSDYLQFLDIKL